MIEKRVVSGGAELNISKNLSFGKYVLDNLRRHCDSGNKSLMINASTCEQTSYSQLLEIIIKIANGMKKMRLGPKDVIGICGENSCEYIAAAVGAVCAGATATVLSFKYSRDELLHVLNISQPKLVFCSESVVEAKLETLRECTLIQKIIQMNGTVKEVDVVSLNEFMVDEGNVIDFEPEHVDSSEDIAFICYSSGTTGLPKGVMLTHRNVVYGCAIFTYSHKERAKVLTIPPWSHVYGLLTSVQMIADGNMLVYLTQFDPEQFLAAIQMYQPAILIAVPSIIHLLAKSSLVKNYDLSSVNVIWSAAGVLSPHVCLTAKQTLPNCKKMLQAYGMTETALAVLKEPENYDHNIQKKEGSCGTPLPGVTVKVVNIDTGENVEAYHHGEICIKSPTVMKGYIGNEKATREMFDEEGFLKTGDLGYYDADGHVYIIDRLKEIFKYNGQQVSPAMVESVILQHNDVSECGVVGVRDEVAGELPTAIVVKRPGATLTEQELVDFTRPRLSPCSRLRGGVIFVSEIPKNSTGKILRHLLRDRLHS